MSTLLFTQREPPGDSESQVRSTVTVVDGEAETAVQEHAPEYNEFTADPDTAGGLTRHLVASHVIGRERYVPHLGNANENFSDRIDDQISTAGTAAAREAAGTWGHGTLQITEGIEPAIRDGDKLGADYFTVHPRPLSGSGVQITPAQTADPTTVAASQAGAERNARQAVAASQYGAMYRGFMGGIS